MAVAFAVVKGSDITPWKDVLGHSFRNLPWPACIVVIHLPPTPYWLQAPLSCYGSDLGKRLICVLENCVNIPNKLIFLLVLQQKAPKLLQA